MNDTPPSDVMTSELVAAIRCELLRVMASGFGEVTIQVVNHRVDMLITSKSIKLNGKPDNNLLTTAQD